uniref:PTS EIIB type-3 domain-containing protein n=2 Tax=Thermogemmatispora TaxID=768669 RepID=A0A455T3U7_9CHLR|nr:hypothetical protein KTA_13640 [Thermogemmatispora argillosa]
MTPQRGGSLWLSSFYHASKQALFPTVCSEGRLMIGVSANVGGAADRQALKPANRSGAGQRGKEGEKRAGVRREGASMIRVLIVCSWGMSTSLLVESMLEAAAARNYTLSVEALSAGEYMDRLDECDVVLIAPQIRHLRKSIEKLAQEAGKPVALIEPFHYATMNGEAVLEQVLLLLQGTQEGQAQP